MSILGELLKEVARKGSPEEIEHDIYMKEHAPWVEEMRARYRAFTLREEIESFNIVTE